ncbi:MAG: S8 family serine peptidase [Calothrix sp. SM1_7_51]|nr:S8 family serine peptidase [Calothrix sp. SM1_7_51]
MYLNYTSNLFSSHKELNTTPISSVNFSPSRHSLFSTPSFQTRGTYSSSSGYGLANAAAAVASANGEKNPYPDVSNLGGNDWGADMVKAPSAWAKGYTGQGIVVAVVDTGIDFNHQDLKDNIWTNPKEIDGNGKDDDGNGYVDDIHGWNFVSNNSNVMDENGHGTHVSGTIAAQRNNTGATGIAYGAKIMPVKVLDGNGTGSSENVAKGIRFAADSGANVINLSLGSSYPDKEIESAIEYANGKGSVVVMAAGNDGGSTPEYPARYAKNWGVAVGAVDKNNKIANFSNRAGSDKLPYVTAPGVDIYSTLPNNSYGSYSGTSMAAPHVAGVVALMLSANPNLNPNQVKQILTDSAGSKSDDVTPPPGFRFPFPLPFSFQNNNLLATSSFEDSNLSLQPENLQPETKCLSNTTSNNAVNSSYATDSSSKYNWNAQQEDLFANSFRLQSQPLNTNSVSTNADDSNPQNLIAEITRELERYQKLLEGM